MLPSSLAQYELRVDIQDFSGQSVLNVKYNSFWIGEERLFFRLFIGEYEGTAGDSLTYHNYKTARKIKIMMPLKMFIVLEIWPVLGGLMGAMPPI